MNTHKQVFRFDVSVNDVVTVQVLHSTGQIEQHTAGVPFSVFVGGGESIKEVTTLQKENNSRVIDEFNKTSVSAVESF